MSVPVIVWDAGHGGIDPGACLGARHESNDVLKLVLAAGKKLEAEYECKSVYTRKTDIYKSPSKRASEANKIDADLFVSVHRNDATDTSANGFEVCVFSLTGIKYELGKLLCEDMENIGFRNRGVKARPNLTVLRATDMNAVLLEVGFIRNKKDNKLFDDRFNEIVEAIVKDVAKVMYLKKKCISVGDKVRINKGAVYAGSHAGKAVSTYAMGRVHTIAKIDADKNALLKEINSWVNIKYLYKA